MRRRRFRLDGVVTAGAQRTLATGQRSPMSQPDGNAEKRVVRLEMRRVERRIPSVGMAVFRSPVGRCEGLIARFYAAQTPDHRAFVNEMVAATLEAPAVDPADVDTWTERARAIARVAIADAAGCASDYRRLAGSGLSGDERLYRAMRACSASRPDTTPRAGSEAGGGHPLRSLGRELFFVYLGVSILLGTPVVGAILKALSPGNIGPEEGVELVSIAFTTAPLTLGFTAAVYLYLTVTEGRAGPPFVLVVGWAAIAFVSLVIADAVGNLDSEAQEEYLSEPPPQFHPFVAVPATALWVYLAEYGPGLFTCALLIGGYAAWKWHSVIHHRAGSRS
jgi:hypothetical protein